MRKTTDWWLFATACLFAGLVAYYHITNTGRFDWPQIFGYRQDATFDLWSFQHLMSGVLIGAVLHWLAPDFSRSKLRYIGAVMLLTYGWEALELQMELGTFGHGISTWKEGFEHWSNRLIGDSSLGLIGAFISRRFHRAWQLVLVPVICWLVLNVISPTSMDLQRRILGNHQEVYMKK